MAEIAISVPADAGLMGELIAKMRVSSRMVGSYPEDHPAVQSALQQVHASLEEIFHQRKGITLAVGKEGFVIDAHIIDKENLLYRQMARHLRRLGIAYIHFSPGFTIDELYNLHHFISGAGKDSLVKSISDIFNEYDLPHINVGFLDYEAFSFEEGKTTAEICQEDLWETYIASIVNGTLKIEALSEEIGDISLDTFANLLVLFENRGVDRISSQKIVSMYVKKFFQKSFSNKEMKKLLALIRELSSNLKEQFLCAVIETLSRDILVTSNVFQNMSAVLIMELFETVQSKKIDIPENLKNLLDVVLNFESHAVDQRIIGDSLLVDDISVSSNPENTPSESDMGEFFADPFETSATDDYQKEIKSVLAFDASEMASINLPELKREIDDDFIEKIFNNVILEIMSSDLVSEAEYLRFIENLKEQTTQFIVTGQYEQVLRIRKLLQLNMEKGKFADITSEALKHYSTSEFLTAFIDSLRIMGRQARDQAWQLCEDYGEMIIPFLMDALINEKTPSSRSLLLSLIRQFGDTLVDQALRRLRDSRWFVKRNMLYLLRGCKNRDIIPYVRPYCDDENPKVSFEAIKCLLSLKDSYAVERLMGYLRSGTLAEREQAITLLGVHTVEEAVPELILILKKKKENRLTLPQEITIVQALGNIGDARSLNTFRKILFRRKFVFFAGAKENLKMEIYRTMKNFPYGDIEDILREGLKSRNEYIKNESLRLIKIRKQ